MGCCDTSGLMPVNTAISRLLEQALPPTHIEDIALQDALHRIVAEDICSPINVPPFANSAMDGYAVRIADLSEHRCLAVAGKSMAGAPFRGEFPVGSCVRIMTGAVIPAGADAVVMQEQTEQSSAGITLQTMPTLAENIRPIGDDTRQGEVVIAKGTKLTVREMPLLASLGIATVKVFRKPRVAFFSTGDELRQVGEPLAEGEIYDSNRYTLATWLTQMQCEPIDLGVVADNKASIEKTLLHAADVADLVLTSGGVSVGDADFIKDVLAEVGNVNFWKIAIKPGKPFAFGSVNNALFCGLPGNPVSVLVTLHVLVQPLLAKLAGHSQWQPSAKISAIADTPFKKAVGRTDYQRAFFHVDSDGKLHVSSTGNQGSGAFSSMTKANCFAVLEQARGHVAIGETLLIEPFDACLM